MTGSTEREKQKAKIRSNMLEGKGKRYSIQIPAVVLEYKNYMAAALLMVIAAVVVIGAVMKIYGHFRTYSTYQVDWSVEISNSATATCVNFLGGAMMVGKDGAVFYNSKGAEEWAVPYEMDAPVAVKEGQYVLIYDWKGRSMVVCGKNGRTGSMSTSYPISRADISAGGVTAAVLEDTMSSYISYYRSNGEALEINIQSPFATNGYPLDISISPDGQQLAVSYYYIGGGSGACRMDFYNFKAGEELPNRLAGTFSYKESDTYIPMVTYGSNSTAFGVGDNQLCFYAISGTQIEQKIVAMQGEIRKIFFDETHLGVLTEEEDGLKIRIYDADGEQKDVIEQDSMYENYSFDGEQIVMYNESHCRILTFSGRERFNLSFVNGIEELTPAGNQRCFYLATMDALQRITLK